MSLNYPNPVKDKYLITGASSSLGLALCQQLLKEEKKIIAVVRDEEVFQDKIGGDLIEEGHIEIWRSDLSKTASISKICKKIERSSESIKAFIHLAADSSPTNFDPKATLASFNVSLISGWSIANACIRSMRNNHYGRILFIGSVGHQFGGRINHEGYSTAKQALEFFPKVFRICGKYNVLVNTLRLGVFRGETHSKLGLSEQELNIRVSQIPTQKAVLVEEAVVQALFLCSEENKSFHNAVIPLTNGE